MWLPPRYPPANPFSDVPHTVLEKTESWNAHLATWPVWPRSTWDQRATGKELPVIHQATRLPYQVRVLVTVGLRSLFRFCSIILHHLPVASINQRILWHLHHVFFFFFFSWGGGGLISPCGESFSQKYSSEYSLVFFWQIAKMEKNLRF